MLHGTLTRMQHGTRGLTATERRVLLVAPALGIAAAVATAVGFTPPPAQWAQVYTGPTDQPGPQAPGLPDVPVAWRIQVKQAGPNQARGSVLEGQLRLSYGPGRTTSVAFLTNSDGIAWVTIEGLPRGAGALEALVVERDRVLAHGRVNVPLHRWAGGKRTDGGWCTGLHEGPVEIRLGIIDGVLLHGYPSAALVVLRENGHELADQPLLLKAEGAKFSGGTNGSQVMLVSDAHGIARFQLQSADMAASLSVELPGPKASRLLASLPVRTGGLRAFRQGQQILVTTSVPTERAWLGLLTEGGLRQVQALELRENAGNWIATATFAQWPKPPIWAVVSSEPELDSMNTLGWPVLDDTERNRAHATLVVPNVLALNGRDQVMQALEKQRKRAVAASFAILLVVAALMAWVVLRANARHARRVHGLAKLVDGDASAPLGERSPLALIAILVMPGALVALAGWAAL